MKAPEQKTDLKDFLSMFDLGRQRTLSEEAKNEEYNLIMTDFIHIDGNETIKTEAFYCTRLG